MTIATAHYYASASRTKLTKSSPNCAGDNMRTHRLLLLLLLVSVTTLVFAAIGDGNWLYRVPERERLKQNPFDSDRLAVAAGAKLFRQNCASCHGDGGAGRDKKPNLHTERVRSASP